MAFRYLSVSGCEASQLNKKLADLGSLNVPPSASVEARTQRKPGCTPRPRHQSKEGCSPQPLTHPFLPASYPRTASGPGGRYCRTNPAALETWRGLPHEDVRGRAWQRSLIGPGPKPSSMIGSQSNGREKPVTGGERIPSLRDSADQLRGLWRGLSAFTDHGGEGSVMLVSSYPKY